MRSLVTGANGFIGSHVVRQLLAQGRQVRAFILPGTDESNLEGLDVERTYGDVLDARAVREAMDGCETLYHLAAIYAVWMRNPQKMWDVNVTGTSVMLNAARDARVKRVVYTSSIAAVGHRDDGTPADEETRFNTWGDSLDYVRTKYLSEEVARSFIPAGLDLVFCNPAFPFGTGDVGPTPTGQIIVDVARGVVRGWLEGGFCAVDVENVAAAHVLAEQKGRTGERYILGEHNVHYRDFFRMVCERVGKRFLDTRIPHAVALTLAGAVEAGFKLRGKRPPMTYGAMRYALLTLHFDTSKAHRELGMPTTPLEETLDKAVAYFRERGKF